MSALRRVLEVLVPIAFLTVAVEAIIAIPARAINLALAREDMLIYLPGFLLAVLAILAGRQWHSRLSHVARHIGGVIERVPPKTWAFVAVTIGIGLRLAWALVFPVDPTSDARTYVNLAQGLLENGTFEANGTFAYWPPGYPFFLLCWLAIIDSIRMAILSANLALFLLSLWLTWRFGDHCGHPAAGRLAGLLIALWPAVWMGSAIAQKEQLLIPLLLAILLCFEIGMSRTTGSRRAAALVGTGLLLGFATLVQPSLQLLISVLIFQTLLHRSNARRKVTSLLLVAITAALVVGWWTARNYQVLGAFVPVSTNGGSVLYRANNPLATGGYTSEGEISLKGLGELEANAKGFALGKEWIVSNPAAFLRLAAWKQILFLGDDSAGAFDSLRRGSTDSPHIVFVAAKAASNAFWLTIWLACTACLAARLGRHSTHPPIILGFMLGFLYLYVLHSVFESSGRYHLPVIGFLAGICAYLVSTSTSGSSGATLVEHGDSHVQ